MMDEDYMRLALAVARKGIEEGQLPFGAVVVKDSEVIGNAHNMIYEDTNIIAHAETIAIAGACHHTGSIDLSGCTLYATCEPCPMCFGACVLANVSRIVYSARMGDGVIPGFSMLVISNQKLKKIGEAEIKITGDCLRTEGVELFKLWRQCHMKTP